MSALVLLGALLLAAPGTRALDEQEALRISQAVIGNPIGAFTFANRDGVPFDFAGLLGKPVLVSPIYTSCFHTCPVITQRLAQSVEVARDVLGKDAFSVVTVGFDAPNDTPQRMRVFARERHIDTSEWYFLSGDAATIERFTQALGFFFTPTAWGFEHLAQVTVLDSDGRVYRQIYGADFDPPAVVEPLRELLLGKARAATDIGGILDRIRLFCTVYDPASGRYGFDYSLAVVIFTGVMSLGAVLYFIIVSWRQSAGETRG